MRHEFHACLADLPALLAALRTLCRAAGLEADEVLRAELVIEETFSNSIRHGYGGERPHKTVWLTGEILHDGVRLVYEDEAPPFDPLQELPPLRQEGEGGAGSVLLKSLPRRAVYRRIGERNVLTVEFCAGNPVRY